ncbi:MAG TPA: hypothetical protein VMC79_04045 [Rectinemataceae bacterium]|nr:hypothetical protein [Rectinemataceae bacterium]
MAESAKSGSGAKDVKAWVAAVNMGLGHKRAVAPLATIAEGGILIANDPAVATHEEMGLWESVLELYERLSRVKKVPLIGPVLFGIMDWFQKIQPAYPRVDLSKPSVGNRMVDSTLKKGLCAGMLARIKTKPLPLVTSHFQPALAADRDRYGRIYCIICDADINRVWVASDPRSSRIEYLVPCGAAMRRLKQYGVPDERIFMTGFPLPLELLGDENLDVLKADLGQRLRYLDPTDRFWPLHDRSVEHFLGEKNCRFRRDRSLTITYAVGGAGAQREIGATALESLRDKVKSGSLAVNLVCGVRAEVREYFETVVKELGLAELPNVRVVGGRGEEDYFSSFAACLKTTDILWTKPSELSFYVGLGIPLLMAPTIGSQEVFNRHWLEEVQAGIPQDDPRYANEWLYELLEQGRFAEAAWSGFLKARKYGTYRIHELLATGAMYRSGDPLTR